MSGDRRDSGGTEAVKVLAGAVVVPAGGVPAAGGALELDVLRDDGQALEFNVTRCRYAEMYRRLGLAGLGPVLSCNRDGSMIEGFNPDIEFRRTQTLMEGAPCCDFRYRKRTQQ